MKRTNVRPTLNIITGSTTGGLDALREYHRIFVERFKDQEMPVLNIAIDTDVERMAEVKALLSSPPNIRFLPLEANLKALVEKPKLHPEVAETLSGLSKANIPSSLDRGSQKVLSFTLAAFQARWATPDGLCEEFQKAMKRLQQWQREFGGTGKFLVNCTGLMCGGVGGILPILAAAAIRTLGEEVNPGFGRNLEINLFWIEPWPEENDARILANARGALEILEAAQQGRLRIPVPRTHGLDHIGTSGPLFDNVFVISEANSKRPDHHDFIRGLAEFLHLWSFDPLAADVQSRLQDITGIREEEVEGHKRFLQSFGVGIVRIGDALDYATAICIDGLSKSIEQRVSPLGEDIEGKINEVFQGHGLLLNQLNEKLSHDSFGRPYVSYDDLKETIYQGVLSRIDEERAVDFWLEKELIPRVLNQVDKAFSARLKEIQTQAEQAIEEDLLKPLQRELDLKGCSQLLEGMRSKIGALSEDAQSLVLSPSDETLKRALTRLERARMGFRLTRRGRVAAQAQSLTNIAAVYLDQRVEELRFRKLVQFYAELEKFVEEKRREVYLFDQALAECVADAKTKLSGPAPLKNTRRSVVTHLLNEAELRELVVESLGCPPDKLSQELIASVAETLLPWKRWAGKSEELRKGLLDFFATRLQTVAKLNVPNYVRWKAHRNSCSEKEVWTELVSELQAKTCPWWFVDPAAFPSNAPLRQVKILGIPEEGLPLNLVGIDLYKALGDPSELVLFLVEIGAHKASLGSWRSYSMVQLPQDGKGPIIPPSLKVDQQDV